MLLKRGNLDYNSEIDDNFNKHLLSSAKYKKIIKDTFKTFLKEVRELI
jgi:hypothetical protein